MVIPEEHRAQNHMNSHYCELNQQHCLSTWKRVHWHMLTLCHL